MDENFLKFWKNAFNNAAQGIQQLETLSQWMNQGMKGVKEVSHPFRNAYGLERLPEASQEAQRLWDKAVADFQASYQAFIDGMGLVPMEKYTTLLKKCKEQEAIIAEQEEELSRLRLQIQFEKAQESVKGFARLMESQASQFQKTMDAMGTFWGPGKIKGKE